MYCMFLGLFFGACVLALGVVTRCMFSYRSLFKIARSNHKDLCAFLDLFPISWCIWEEKSSYLTCSSSFYDVLHLPLKPLVISDVWTIFNQQVLEFSNIEDFLLSGKKISITIFADDKQRVVCVESKVYQKRKETFFCLFVQTTDSSSDDSLKNLATICQDFTLLLDTSPLLIWKRASHKKLDFCNFAYAHAFETNAETVLEKNFELVPFAAPDKLSSEMLALRATRTREAQTLRTHVIIHGERRYMEIVETPVYHQDTATIGYAIDITEKENLERDLLTYTRSYHDILFQMSSPIAIYGADERLIFFNYAYVKEFDFHESWLCARPTFSQILDDLRSRRKMPEYSDFAAHRKERLSLFQTLFSPIHEIMHQPDGQTLRLIIIPQPLGGLVFIFENMTQQLVLERGYKTLLAVQKTTLDHLYEGILVVGMDYQIRLLNPRMCVMWGISQDRNFVNAHFSDFFPGGDSAFENEDTAAQWHKNILLMMDQRQHASGQLILKAHVIVDYAYVPLPDGSHLLTFSDVSSRYLVEQALYKQHKALVQVDRLKSKFISHVSYELKAPLNTIHGFADILFNQYFGPLNDRQLHYFQGITESVDRLRILIDDMLDLAEIEAGKMALSYQSVSLNSFLENTASLIRHRAQDQGIELTVHNTCSLDKIDIDPRRLKHAIFNLLTNATKFTPSGGKVLLEACDSRDNPGYIDIFVQDTGVGIPIDDQERIFHLFEKGDGARQIDSEGSGLGLSLVQKLIEHHGGKVFLHSVHQKGTTVTCQIPIAGSHTTSYETVALV